MRVGQIDRDVVSKSHFGGFGEEDEDEDAEGVSENLTYQITIQLLV